MTRALLVNIGMLAIGASIGSIATCGILKPKYEQRNKEDIESMRQYYKNKYGVSSEISTKEDAKDPSDRSLKEIREIISDFGYSEESKTEKNKEQEEDDMLGPEIIAPQESWERDYPTLSLTYYEGDGVLANDDGKIIDNADELVGKDFISHFGEYEDDSVYVRNERMKCQYEILRDYGSYSENYC